MSFSYNPVLDEAEALKLKEFPMLPNGIYNFIVTDAKFSYSQSNNPMIKLTLTINHNGKDYFIYDHLLASPNMIWKTKHFCEAVGLDEEYKQGHFNENCCYGKRGKCDINTQPERPKNDGSGTSYKAKNIATDYINAANISVSNLLTPAEPMLNDDVPF